MKKLIYIFPLFLSLLLICEKTSSQTFQWVKSMGSENGETAKAVATDAAGNVYIAGTKTDTIDFDPGAGVYNLLPNGTSTDGYLAKYDSAGNLLWAFNLGSGNYDEINSIAPDPDGNIYVTGSFTQFMDVDPGPGVFYLTSGTPAGSALCIIKYSSAGNLIWGKAVGGGTFIDGKSIAVDAGRNVLVTGSFGLTFDFDPGAAVFNLTSAGSNDCFVLKLDSLGNFIWAKRMGGTSDDRAFGISADAYGNVYTTGYYTGAVDFNPGNGVFTLASNNNTSHAYVQRLDASGNFVWAKGYTGSAIAFSQGYSLSVDASNSVYITGVFRDSIDFDPNGGTYFLRSVATQYTFITKLKASGNFVWARMLANGPSYTSDISTDNYGGLFISGYWSGLVDFDPGAGSNILMSNAGTNDAYVDKLDTAGNFIWVKAFGGTASDMVYSVAKSATGTIYFAGAFGNQVDFNPGTGPVLNSKGSNDIFIVKYTEALPCLAPTGLTTTNISSSGAKLNWNPVNGAVAYQQRYRVTGTTPWTYKTSTSSTKTLSSLQSQTPYQWQVRTKCSLNPLVWSSWSAIASFQSTLRTSQLTEMSQEAAGELPFLLLPNPAQSKVMVQVEEAGDTECLLTLVNSLGQLVYAIKLFPVEGFLSHEIELNGYAPGIYSVNLQYNSSLRSRKLIIR